MEHESNMHMEALSPAWRPPKILRWSSTRRLRYHGKPDADTWIHAYKSAANYYTGRKRRANAHLTAALREFERANNCALLRVAQPRRCGRRLRARARAASVRLAEGARVRDARRLLGNGGPCASKRAEGRPSIVSRLWPEWARPTRASRYLALERPEGAKRAGQRPVL